MSKLSPCRLLSDVVQLVVFMSEVSAMNAGEVLYMMES